MFSLSYTRLQIIKIIILLGGLYLFFVTLFSRSLADNDLWGYLAFGGILFEEGYFPFHDVFSYTPTKPLWIYHEWLTGVIFFSIHKYSGPAGLQLLRYVVILMTIYLIYMTALKKGGSPLTASIAIIPAMLLISFGYVPVRAQIFTYFFFILTIYILEDARITQKWSPLWWLLPIHILWCNLHGGYVAGLGLVGLYAAGEGLSGRVFMPYVKVGICATLVTLINPYGVEYWYYTLSAVSMPRPEIGEWMSIITAISQNEQVLPVIVFLILSFLGVIIFTFQRSKDLTDFMVLAVTIYLGAKHIRHGVLFGLVFGSYMPVMLSQSWKEVIMKFAFLTRYSHGIRLIPAVLSLILYLLINPSLSVTTVPSFAVLTPSPIFPEGAVHWIKANQIRGNILPHFDWGEFLIWNLYPGCHVAMDGRYETVYQDQVFHEYFDFLMGRDNWTTFLKKYPHDIVLLVPNTRTSLLMLKEADWRVAYRDGGSILFVRKSRS